MSSYSNKSKLHVRIRNFVNWIAPEKATRDKIKKQSNEIREKLKSKAEEDGLTITDMPYSGSFAKKNGLRRHLLGETTTEGQDVDLAFVIKVDGQTEFAPLIEKFKTYAEKSYPDTNISTTKSSVKMKFESTKLTYDIVPMFATDDVEKQILFRNNGDKIKTSVQKHTAFVRSRTIETNEEDGIVAFNDCIRLIKWWRCHKEQTTNEIIKIPSFLIDLLAAEALKKASINTTYPQTLANWFSCLSDVVYNNELVWFDDNYKKPMPDSTNSWNVLDPVMADNNIVKTWKGWEISELQDWFTEAAETINRAIVADIQGRDNDSLEHMKTLFGKIFSSHCD